MHTVGIAKKRKKNRRELFVVTMDKNIPKLTPNHKSRKLRYNMPSRINITESKKRMNEKVSVERNKSTNIRFNIKQNDLSKVKKN